MRLKYDMTGEVYKRFLDFAFEKYDTVMFVHNGAACIYYYKKHLRFLKKHNNGRPINKQTIDWLKRREAESRVDVEIFDSHCVPFVKNFEPFKIKTRNTPEDGWMEWPHTRAAIKNVGDININFYKMDPEIKKWLLEPKSFFDWRYPRYPEDLSFFKDGYCWVPVCSHEEDMSIYPESYEEYQRFVEMGIEFFDPYEETQKEWLFYEDYKL